MAIPNENNVSEMSEAYQIGWLDFFWNRFLNFYRCFLGVLWPGGRLESGQNLPGATSSALHSRMSLTWTFIPIKKWPPIFFNVGFFWPLAFSAFIKQIDAVILRLGLWSQNILVFPNWVGTRPTTKPDRDQVERLKARCYVHLPIQIWHVLRSIMHSRGRFDIV